MNEIKRIEPRTLKGFRDYLPEAMIPRERLIDTARRVYRSYGFAPIDTPALEYLEILTGKGSEETDKQLYKFQEKDTPGIIPDKLILPSWLAYKAGRDLVLEWILAQK